MNRTIEYIIALFGFLVLCPVFAVLALAVKLDSPGPVFYRSRRAGKGERSFYMLKFRTMREDAHKTGPPVTTRNDARITRVGSLLRKTKLDELPQLINVIRGDMKFVGPRPEDPDIVEAYTEDQKHIFAFRPGITSPASLEYRDEEEHIPPEEWERVYMKEILPKKIRMDMEYMRKAGFRKDLGVIIRTILNK
ncbi:sugar transferase [bacterium]|nr:sugar transferase [bacterium]